MALVGQYAASLQPERSQAAMSFTCADRCVCCEPEAGSANYDTTGTSRREASGTIKKKPKIM